MWKIFRNRSGEGCCPDFLKRDFKGGKSILTPITVFSHFNCCLSSPDTKRWWVWQRFLPGFFCSAPLWAESGSSGEHHGTDKIRTTQRKGTLNSATCKALILQHIIKQGEIERVYKVNLLQTPWHCERRPVQEWVRRRKIIIKKKYTGCSSVYFCHTTV